MLIDCAYSAAKVADVIGLPGSVNTRKILCCDQISFSPEVLVAGRPVSTMFR